jgi:hypothetical protein
LRDGLLGRGLCVGGGREREGDTGECEQGETGGVLTLHEEWYCARVRA